VQTKEVAQYIISLFTHSAAGGFAGLDVQDYSHKPLL
jgi:hypothetical protein